MLIPKALLLVALAALAFQANTPTKASVPKFTANKVAGEYYFGDGLGVNCHLKLAVDNTFTFRWTGCLGEYDKNGGRFHFEGDELVLELTQPNNRQGFQGTPTRFYPVQWGKRMYMVAEEDMAGFCEAVASGWQGDSLDAIHGDHYVRINPNDIYKMPAVSGKPDVPVKYRPWINKRMLVSITKIENGKIYLDRGSADGIVQGLKLFERGHGFDWVYVEKCTEHDAVARMWDKKDKMPKVGAKLYAFDLNMHTSARDDAEIFGDPKIN